MVEVQISEEEEIRLKKKEKLKKKLEKRQNLVQSEKETALLLAIRPGNDDTSKNKDRADTNCDILCSTKKRKEKKRKKKENQEDEHEKKRVCLDDQGSVVHTWFVNSGAISTSPYMETLTCITMFGR